MFLVSPTEPAAVRVLGSVSPLSEHHGADVMWGSAGVQRKTLTDLVVSMRSGRLGAELGRMSASSLLAVRVLVVEGRIRWSAGGTLAAARPAIDRAALRGLLLSVQLAGVWVVHTDDLADTVAAIEHLRRFLDKPSHTLVRSPAVADGPWEERLLRCFPSVGAVTARAITDHFGGVPLRWACNEVELSQVPGVGPKRAAALLGALSPGDRGPRRATAAS